MSGHRPVPTLSTSTLSSMSSGSTSAPTSPVFIQQTKTTTHEATLKLAGTTYLTWYRHTTVPSQTSHTFPPSLPSPYNSQSAPVPTVILLHGGPGATSDYLWPVQDMLTSAGISSVVYDQVGNGRSESFTDVNMTTDADKGDFWTVETFDTQLRALIRHLGLRQYVLWGHSWGGMLAVEHVLANGNAKGSACRKLILQSSLACMATWARETAELRAGLPEDVRGVLDACDADGQMDSVAYKEACGEFYKRFSCRLDPWPDSLEHSVEWCEREPGVYARMWGKSEFDCSGTLRDWDVRARLAGAGLEQEVLLLNGEHDEATETVVEELWRGFAKCRWVTIEGASHNCHLEKPDRVERIALGFLRN